jgi:aspartyl-tRNA(Asn)/glutamyl-tRNA(Gln) amidotransferase subunit A
VGLKPTYGLVPIRGIVPLTVSLDHCGPMTRTVADAALILDVLAGFDRLDITSVEHPKESYSGALSQPVSGLRLGIPAYFYDQLDDEVDRAVKAAIGVLSGLTQGATDATLPPFTSVGGLGGGAETYAYHREFFEKSPGRYTLPVRRRLEAMSKLEGNGAAYVRSKWALDLLRRTVDDAFTDFDVLITPTERILPPLLMDLLRAQRDPAGTSALAEAVANTSPYDVYGLPAISLPCGFSKSGLPIGLTIAGPRFSEGRILALARAYEQATEWHKRRPALSPDMPVPSVKPA